jgi:hypothetical protein
MSLGLFPHTSRRIFNNQANHNFPYSQSIMKWFWANVFLNQIFQIKLFAFKSREAE